MDVVVSNPPYLSDDEVAELPPDVQREPTLALAAGVEGLDVLRRLIVGAWEYLNPRGLLALEIDPRVLRRFRNVSHGRLSETVRLGSSKTTRVWTGW